MFNVKLTLPAPASLRLLFALIAVFFGLSAGGAAGRDAIKAVPVADDAASLRIARALRTAGDPRSAVQIYRRMVAAKGSTPDIQLEFGQVLMAAGLFDEAISVFTAIPPTSGIGAEAQFGLARAQLQMNQPAQALALIDRAIAMAPANPHILIGRGVALDRLGRHPEAQASYRAALAITPRSIAARNDLALSLALSGRSDEAIAILSPIARSADATAADRQNLAFIYGLKGDGSAALALSRVDLDEATAQANAQFFVAAAGGPAR